jgi:hypothetical protein
LRKPYSPQLGAVGESFEDRIVKGAETAGIEVIAQVGKTADKFAPADVALKLGGRIVELQLETRDYELERFSTIHLPDELLRFTLLVEESKTGRLFVTPVECIKYSPKIIVKNKYDGGKDEYFYDVDKNLFKRFDSIADFCEWLKTTYGR